MATGTHAAYGLELAPGRLVLARTFRRGIPQVLLAAAPDSGDARRLLQAVMLEVEKGSAVLAVSAPAAQTVIRRLRAPFASIRKAAKVWNSLLDVELPFPVESALCAYGSPRVEAGGTVALAAAIRTGDLAAFEETCRATGFDPTHCDVEALALWDQQGAEAPPARSGLPRAIVWLGTDHVTIVRGRGADFMAAHVLRASPLADSPGERQAFEALWSARARQIVAAHLEETGADEMDLWWAGPGAEEEARAVRLRQALPAEFALRHETHRQPASFLARALARRAADDSGVNFKTGDLTHPARRRMQERSLRMAYLGVIAASILVLMLNGLESVLRRRCTETVQQHLMAAAQAIAGSAVVPGQESLMVERAIPRRDGETQAFRTAMDPVGVEGQWVRAIEAAGALDVDISRLSLSSAALSVEGSAAGIQAIESLVEGLRKQAWAIQSDSPGLTPEGRQRFILKGAVSHGG